MGKSKNRIMVYSDLSLDDCCAIEYLSKKYEGIVLIITTEVFSLTADFVSDRLQTLESVQKWLGSLFTNVTIWEGYKYADCDCMVEFVKDEVEMASIEKVYSFSSLTLIASHYSLEGNKISDKPTVMVAGDTDSFSENEEDWNAADDIEAYKSMFSLAKNLEHFSRERCGDLYKMRGVPYDTTFQQELEMISSELDFGECNDSLQAVYEE